MSHTSSMAIDHMNATGKAAKLRHQVIQKLANCPNSTANEVAILLSLPRDTVSPRLAELARMGLVHSTGTRACYLTHRTCKVWALGGEAKPKRETAYERGYKAGYEQALLDQAPSNPIEKP